MNDLNSRDETQDLGGNQSELDQTVSAEHPERIGRYRIQEVLGKGGFGLVFLAQDEQLERPVAVKVPHAWLITGPEAAEAYLDEARTVANLDHPHIVPVYDVGSTDEYPCYIVSKYIPGTNLATRLQRARLGFPEAAALVATVADALHYAHKQGLVDRDVKPGNILLDQEGRPYVVDFGLALRESAVGQGPRYAGTPAYMSPEQARGEGHRVDGRSDIYSLGAVLYELLTGRRTVTGDRQQDLLEQVASQEVKPPRQINDRIPLELERICLKALAKRASDRYTTALDMAEDLRHFLDTLPQSENTRASASAAQMGQADFKRTPSESATNEGDSTQRDSASHPIRIVPKGLRSFDAHDAEFFLELLPGPRDCDGLPDCIRFWKTRIEETDAVDTFPVGLIYGPSGCGKSSLVKAGLIPRLSDKIIPVFVEATPDETESRLLHGLRKHGFGSDGNLSLKDTLATLRLGLGIPAGCKVLIVLDQFEQWLHARNAEENPELVRALRQCDGTRVQCIVMVRDDFWMAATRFMRELEVRLVEGQNSAAVDLFPIRHAERVLASFGRALGTLPNDAGQISKTQMDFLRQSVAGLSEGGKVICVRLALFAQMMKVKTWAPATLREVGGMAGVGVAFLDETFSASTSPPQHRYHQNAARAVLKSLLPESGTDIKGHMWSRAELLQASGYEHRPRDFEDLMRILDSETRLITPTDPAGGSTAGESVTASKEMGREFYQLTHDYLIPSLKDWLTRKQKETRPGRAELALVDCATVWAFRQENKHLPSLWQWLQILRYTRAGSWTESQRKMMGKARRVYGFRATCAGLCLVVLVFVGAMIRNQVARQQETTRIEGLIGRLISAEPSQLTAIVGQLEQNAEVAAEFLSPLLSGAAGTQDRQRAQLHARLAMVARDPALVDGLREELLTNKVIYVGPIRELLRPYAGELTDGLWALLRDEHAEDDRRFRAALALAGYVPISAANAWSEQDRTFVARRLVTANAEVQPLLRQYLRPIRERLLADLEVIFRDPAASDAQRLSAANAFADFAVDDLPRLSNLLTSATPEQFAALYPLVAASPLPSVVEHLAQVAAALPTPNLGFAERIPFGRRRANAAVTLLRLGERASVLPVFAMADDPEALTQFIFRCRPRGVRVDALLDCLQVVTAAPQDRYPSPARYALLLALGAFALPEIPEARRETLLAQVAEWYANDPASGVHSAAGWLLHHWGQAEDARKIEQTEVPYSPDREWFTLAVSVTATKTFFYTFIVFPAGEYDIGSVDDDPDRQRDETRHAVKLTRPFAILDRMLTFEELIAFSPKYAAFMQQYDAHPSDAGFGVDWYDSAGFCRWLGQQFGLPEEDQPYAAPDSLDPAEYRREPDPRVNWAPADWPVDLGRRGFRLPTEAEWEIAARAGSRTAYGFGSDVSLLGRYGWYAENSGKHVHPPRELLPSIRGVFDLHGNLFEWTHDWFYAFESETVTDPLRSEGGTLRVNRGGSWNFDAVDCRASNRGLGAPTQRTADNGFRLAVSPPADSVPGTNGTVIAK